MKYHKNFKNFPCNENEILFLMCTSMCLLKFLLIFLFFIKKYHFVKFSYKIKKNLNKFNNVQTQQNL